MADMYQNELFQKLLKRAQDHAAESAAVLLDLYATFAFSDLTTETPTGSPIEAGFEIWWHAVEAIENFDFNYFNFRLRLERQPQIVIGEHTYRLDFRVIPEPEDPHIGAATARLDVPLPKIAIELDGHDFHEKTKEQVTYRNQRDRDLQRDGWQIFHFSGSEFVRHPQRCVEEVRKEALSRFHDYASAVIKARDAG